MNMKTELAQVKVYIQSCKNLIIKIVKNSGSCLLFCENRFLYTAVATGSVWGFVCAYAYREA